MTAILTIVSVAILIGLFIVGIIYNPTKLFESFGKFINKLISPLGFITKIVYSCFSIIGWKFCLLFPILIMLFMVFYILTISFPGKSKEELAKQEIEQMKHYNDGMIKPSPYTYNKKGMEQAISSICKNTKPSEDDEVPLYENHSYSERWISIWKEENSHYKIEAYMKIRYWPNGKLIYLNKFKTVDSLGNESTFRM